jgi:hypothetical protein
LIAYLAFETGTTSCGPAMWLISRSTFEVSTVNAAPAGTM